MSGQPGTIRVVLADDHPVIRAGLAQLIATAEDIELVGQAGDGAAAVEQARALIPDVVLMDLQMPGVDGVSAIREIVSAGLGVDVLVLTSYSDNERILDALDAGAVGYLLKDVDPDDVLSGVRAVARGESPLHPKAARALLDARWAGGRPQLTAREVEVLQLVRDGLANKQIARQLQISERTVKAHLTSAFSRIGVSDRTQAALWAQRNGL